MNARQRLMLKRLATRVSRVLPRAFPRRVILSYHAVGSGPWSTSEGRFREQITWLAAHVRLRAVNELLEQPPTSDDLQVAVTFDDGYASVLANAAPVLENARISPTLFVSTSRIAEKIRTTSDESKGYYPQEQFLVWDEIADLRSRGWDIGSHGHEHPDLSKEPIHVAREQMRQSKQILEQRLDAPCLLFAYPFGRSTSAVRAAAAECGYHRALGSTHGRVHDRNDPFNVPRIDIRNNYTLEDFIAVIRGDWDYLRLVQQARHALRFYS